MPQDANTSELSADLIEFLRAGRELKYDADDSTIGRIKLKRAAELEITTIRIWGGCQHIIDDPYGELEGLYQVRVYDLVAESEDYDTEGLLCWIVSLKQFGCIDPDHGDIIIFPGVTWTDIVADPLTYLDSQWGSSQDDSVVRVLPWIHFPFKLQQVDVSIAPYGPQCPVHQVPVAPKLTAKPWLFNVLQQRELNTWIQQYQTVFPCSGVPLTEDELLCCSHCRAAEDAWVQSVDDAILPLDATPNPHGWVKCPGCGTRFSTSDSRAFVESRHMTCGQKIKLVS